MVFGQMKSLVQLEIFRRISSKLAFSIKEFYGELAYDEGHMSLSLQRLYRDHLDHIFQHIV